MPKFATFTDDFASQVDPAKWSVSGAWVWDAATQSARTSLFSGFGPSLTSVGGYIWDLTASYIFAKFTFPNPLTSTQRVQWNLVAVATTGANQLLVMVQGTTMTVSVTTAGTTTTLINAASYQANWGPWWRWREAGGTLYFEASVNGQVWSTLASIATPSFVNAMYVYITENSMSSDPVGTYFYLDNINTPTPSAGQWARLTGPQGDRAAVPRLLHGPLVTAVIPFTSPLVRYDTTWTNPVVYRTWDGMCFMEGLFRRSDNAAFGGMVLAILPQGFRPAERTLLNGVCSSDGTNVFARVDIDPDGTLTYQASIASSVWMSVTGRWYAVQ